MTTSLAFAFSETATRTQASQPRLNGQPNCPSGLHPHPATVCRKARCLGETSLGNLFPCRDESKTENIDGPTATRDYLLRRPRPAFLANFVASGVKCLAGKKQSADRPEAYCSYSEDRNALGDEASQGLGLRAADGWREMQVKVAMSGDRLANGGASLSEINAASQRSAVRCRHGRLKSRKPFVDAVANKTRPTADSEYMAHNPEVAGASPAGAICRRLSRRSSIAEHRSLVTTSSVT
jgi:hypothetical protein